jgi:Family of unknown function (DUF6527)
MMLTPKLNLKKVVQSRSEAASILSAPGDAVLIERGTPRWLLLACPCGCGAELPINLDGRAGKAWRLYKHGGSGLSIFPSVWRDTDGGSHFIIWRGTIHLFGEDDYDYRSPREMAESVALSELVRARIPRTGFISYVKVADSIEEDPWDVLDALRYLARIGFLREGVGKQRGTFSRV